MSCRPCTSDIRQDRSTDSNLTRRSGAPLLAFSDSREPLSLWEKSLALATIALVAAYRHLQEVPSEELPLLGRAPYESLCFGMCATLDAVDVLTATVWDESGNRVTACDSAIQESIDYPREPAGPVGCQKVDVGGEQIQTIDSQSK